MNRIEKILLVVVCGAALLTGAACSRGGNETPKPQAYLRIDMPEPAYTLCDTAVHVGPLVLDGLDVP